MSSINGLNKLTGTSLTCTGQIQLNTNLNPGTAGQVIVSQGKNQPAIWGANHAPTPNALSMGSNVVLNSGNTSWDGSIADTINAIDTDTTYQEGNGISIDTTTNPDTIKSKIDSNTIDDNFSGLGQLSVLRVPGQLQLGPGMRFSSTSTFYDGNVGEIINAFGGDYYRDNTTGYLYKQIKPSNFVMDDDSGGDNRWVISDGVNTEGSAVNRGANATQIYAYFDIPTGYKLTGYRVNLNNSAGNPYTTAANNFYYTRAGTITNTGTRTWAMPFGSQGYNYHVSLSGPGTSQPTNGWDSSWVKGDSMPYGILMAYRLYWTSGYFFPGGYVEFQPS